MELNVAVFAVMDETRNDRRWCIMMHQQHINSPLLPVACKGSSLLNLYNWMIQLIVLWSLRLFSTLNGTKGSGVESRLGDGKVVVEDRGVDRTGKTSSHLFSVVFVSVLMQGDNK